MPKTTSPPAEPFLLGWLPQGRHLRDSLAQVPAHEPAPCVAGLLALARRQGVHRAVVRATRDAGSVTFGAESRLPLEAADARKVIAALREAARLPASAPHVVGSFVAPFGRVTLEIRECHDGEKANVEVPNAGTRPDAPAQDALFQELLLSYASGLDTVHGGQLAPEVLLALRLSAESSGLADLAARHLDLTLLAARRGAACAAPLASLAGRALGRLLLTGEAVEDALEMLVECGRLARHPRAEGVSLAAREVLARALPNAPADLGRVLRRTFQLD